MNEEQNCPITQEPIVNLASLECGHSFEFEALERWIKESEFVPVCPVCKSQVLDYATHEVVIQKHTEPVVFSRVKLETSLNNKEAVEDIYTKTTMKVLDLCKKLADHGKLTPDDKKFVGRKRMGIFSFVHNKANLPKIGQEFAEVSAFYKARMAV